MIVCQPVDFDDPRAEGLRAAMREEMDDRYADYPPDFGAESRPNAGQFRDGNGLYVLALDGEEPVGIGGVRTHEDDAEIKNVYVIPGRRSEGIAGTIMAALETWAGGRGFARIILETGERQPEALALYRRLGYERIPCYQPWDDELSVCLGKALSTSSG